MPPFASVKTIEKCMPGGSKLHLGMMSFLPKDESRHAAISLFYPNSPLRDRDRTSKSAVHVSAFTRLGHVFPLCMTGNVGASTLSISEVLPRLPACANLSAWHSLCTAASMKPRSCAISPSSAKGRRRGSTSPFEIATSEQRNAFEREPGRPRRGRGGSHARNQDSGAGEGRHRRG